MDEENINYHRRTLIVATTTVGSLGAVATVVPFASSLMPADIASATGKNELPIEVDIAKLSPGQMMTVPWQKKPVWIFHRTPDMIASLSGHEKELLDPLSVVNQQPENCRNIHRSIRPEIFVAVGLCTHYGCTPQARFPQGSVAADWPGGFWCACHASGFDLAGRVFKNKLAKKNLEVPPHAFLSETRLLIGATEAGAAHVS